jgi:hypothetical protein
MDFGTTITDRNISSTIDEAREPHRNDNVPIRPAPSANTVEGENILGKETPSTNALPEAIWSSWAEIARSNMSVRMYNDLVRLAAAPDGWRGSGSMGLRIASLISFLKFWSLIRDEATEPELALAPDGSLHAEWFESPRKRLDIRFAETSVFF